LEETDEEKFASMINVEAETCSHRTNNSNNIQSCLSWQQQYKKKINF